MTKTKWLIYTVLLGSIPMIGRFLIYLIAESPAPWAESGDIIAFGLVLVITNINILEHEDNVQPQWKTKSIGLSVVLAILMAIMFAAMCFGTIHADVINLGSIRLFSIILSSACLILSYSIIDRISNLGRGSEQS